MSDAQNGRMKSPSKFPLWAGVILFNVSAIFVPNWNNSLVQKGAILGVILILALCAFVIAKWRKRLSPTDVQKSRRISRKMSQAWVVGLMLIVVVVLGQALTSDTTRDFMYGALFVFAALGSIVGLVVAYGKKGLFQHN